MIVPGNWSTCSQEVFVAFRKQLKFLEIRFDTFLINESVIDVVQVFSDKLSSQVNAPRCKYFYDTCNCVPKELWVAA